MSLSKTPLSPLPWGKKEWTQSLIIILCLWIPAIFLLLQGSIDNEIQIAHNPLREIIWLQVTLKFFSQGGLTIMYILLLCLLGLSLKNSAFKDAQKIFLVMFITLIFATITYTTLKVIIQRDRPFIELGELINAVYPADGYSFPSGHTTTGFALVLPFVLLLPNEQKMQKILKIVLVSFAILMGYSRIYLGVHFLSDVLAGAGVAILMVGLATKITNSIFATQIITVETLTRYIKIFLILGICAIPAFAYFSIV